MHKVKYTEYKLQNNQHNVKTDWYNKGNNDYKSFLCPLLGPFDMIEVDYSSYDNNNENEWCAIMKHKEYALRPTSKDTVLSIILYL